MKLYIVDENRVIATHNGFFLDQGFASVVRVDNITKQQRLFLGWSFLVSSEGLLSERLWGANK